MTEAPERIVVTKAAAQVWEKYPAKVGAAPYRRADWRPIETAPKDGNRIWLSGWQPDSASGTRGYWWLMVGAWHGDEWVLEMFGESPAMEPTYWQPIPERPE